MKPVAVLQMVSGADIGENLRQLGELLHRAADEGAGLIVLPENVALMADVWPSDIQVQIDGFLKQLCGWAADLAVWIVAGTLPLHYRGDGSPVPGGRVRQSCLLIDDQGKIRARYDKMHLFDVDVADAQGSYRESARIEPGAHPIVADTPWGRLGLAVCYDLRFPEYFRKLVEEGAELVAVPAAFTHVTGEAHWEVLIRARAIENQVHVLASGQGGQHSASRRTWGHSMVVDPWGTVLGTLEIGAGLVTVMPDIAGQRLLRQRMPVLSHRLL